MENASKALLMAAGVLIGILVLSLALYLGTSFSQLYSDMERQKEDQKLANFNIQYTTYLNRNDLTIYDIMTIVSYAKENNQNYTDEEGNKQEQNIIEIYLNGTKVSEGKNKKDFDNMIKDDQRTITEAKPTLPTYTCNFIGYNDEGRVKIVKIKKNS